MLLTDSAFLQVIVIEHHTIADSELPTRQGIGELQIDIIINDIPTPVRALLLRHEEIALDTQHHRQALGKQRCIQLNDIQRQFVGELLITVILIAAHDEQFGTHVVEGVEIARPAHHFTRHTSRTVKILLSEIGQQLVTVVKAIRHVQRQILLIPVLMTIRSIGIEVGMLTAVQRIRGADTLHILAKVALAFHEAFHPLRHLHIDIQHPTQCNGSLCHTRIVAHLNLGNVLGLHLTQNQSCVAINRSIVDAEVIIGDDILIAGNHQVGHQLQNVHQRLLARQFHTLRINHCPVCLDLDDRQTVFCEHRGRQEQEACNKEK